MQNYDSPQFQDLLEIERVNKFGIHFEVKRKTPFIGKGKTRTFYIRPIPLGCMATLSAQSIRLSNDEDALGENDLDNDIQVTREQADGYARIVATAVINSNFLLFPLIPALAWYLSWHMERRELLALVAAIYHMCSYGDFVHSIRFLSCAKVPVSALRPGEQETLKTSTL